MTKKESTLYDNWRMAVHTSLEQVYGKCSAAKWRAFRDCLEKMQEDGGENGRICSAGTSFFTFAYTYKREGQKRLCYMTGRNTYDFVID